MTTGSELGHILRFSLPMLAGNIFQQLYNIADSIIVGQFLGADAFAAVGATASITYLFYTLCLGTATGAGILMSQYFGAGRLDRVKTMLSNSAYVIFALSIVISVVSVLSARDILVLLDTPDKLIGTSAGYMRIACGGTVAIGAYNWINSAMRSLGDSKTPLIFLGIASVMNVGLDLLFVLVFNMGVNGAAFATVLSQGFSAAASIVYAFAKNPDFALSKSDLRFNGAIAGRCIKTGTPIALQNAMISVSMVALQRVTNSFGETVMAAYTATMRIEQLIQQPFASLNVALSTFVGQNIGAGKSERAVRGYHISLKIVAVISSLMLAVFRVFSGAIVGFFVDKPEVIEIGGAALKLSACFYFALGTIHTTRGFLNGAGDTAYAMVNGFAEVCGRVGFSFLLINIPFIGHWAVWGTTCLTWVLTALLSYIRYRGGKWRSMYEK